MNKTITLTLSEIPASNEDAKKYEGQFTFSHIDKPFTTRCELSKELVEELPESELFKLLFERSTQAAVSALARVPA